MKRLIVISLVLLSMSSCVVAQSQKHTDNLYLKKVSSGEITFTDRQVSIDTLEWNPHPKFKGVYLKHLVLGEDTENQLSCHIVKIEPYCALDTHVHEGKIEIHEVIAGSGKFYLNSKEIEYTQGKISVIPANTPHKVVAEKDGLYLFAKFTPALQ